MHTERLKLRPRTPYIALRQKCRCSDAPRNTKRRERVCRQSVLDHSLLKKPSNIASPLLPLVHPRLALVPPVSRSSRACVYACMRSFVYGMCATPPYRRQARGSAVHPPSSSHLLSEHALPRRRTIISGAGATHPRRPGRVDWPRAHAPHADVAGLRVLVIEGILAGSERAATVPGARAAPRRVVLGVVSRARGGGGRRGGQVHGISAAAVRVPAAELLLLVVGAIGVIVVADARVPGVIRVKAAEATTAAGTRVRARLLVRAGCGALVAPAQLIVEPAADAAATGRRVLGAVGVGVGAREWIVR